MSPKSPRKISRKIHFYRALLAGLDEDGSPTPFDPATALHHIDQLDFSPEGRYLDIGDTTLCCWVRRADPPQKFRFGHIRRTGLPLVEIRGGRLDDLEIPDDSGLVEVIHVVVFENGIIGADFNFYGPRVGRLARTIRGDRDSAPGRRHRNRTRSRTTGNEQWAAAGTSQPRVAGWLSAEWT